MGNKLLLLSLLCCISSRFQNESEIQQTSMTLPTDVIYSGQPMYREQTLHKAHEEEKVKKTHEEQSLHKSHEEAKVKKNCEEQTLQKEYATKVIWGQNFAASFDFKLYQNIVLIVHALWVVKIMARFVC